MRKIAVTGSISSGKSTVCRFLQELGAYQVSCDTLAHRLLAKNTNCKEEIVALFGSDIIQNGEIDRARLAEIAFNQTDKLHKLESILHPLILQDIQKEYSFALESKTFPFFVVEVPLLFEAGWEDLFDMSLCVTRKQALSKDNEKRMERQLSSDEKAKRADYTIENDGTLEELHNKVAQFVGLFTGDIT